MSKHIVILGAGYGGLLAALNVRKYVSKADAHVTSTNTQRTKSSRSCTGLQQEALLSQPYPFH